MRKLQLEGHPKEEDVKRMRLEEKLSIDSIAARLGLPRKQVATYCGRLDKGVAPLKLEAPPAVPAEATPRERAELHAKWLKEQIDKAVTDNAPPKDVASLSNQYVGAMRLVAQLSGALEVTVAQILRSVDFQRLLTAFKRSVGDNRDVWAKWEAELAVLMGEEPGK